jgi:hypothetical protein
MRGRRLARSAEIPYCPRSSQTLAMKAGKGFRDLGCARWRGGRHGDVMIPLQGGPEDPDRQARNLTLGLGRWLSDCAAADGDDFELLVAVLLGVSDGDPADREGETTLARLLETRLTPPLRPRRQAAENATRRRRCTGRRHEAGPTSRRTRAMTSSRFRAARRASGRRVPRARLGRGVARSSSWLVCPRRSSCDRRRRRPR